MDQMHEIDLELNDLRNIYLLPAPLWHCTFAFTHDFLSLAQFLRVLRERCGILHSTATTANCIVMSETRPIKKAIAL